MDEPYGWAHERPNWSQKCRHFGVFSCPRLWSHKVMRYCFHRPRCWCDKYPSNILEFSWNSDKLQLLFYQSQEVNTIQIQTWGPTVLKGLAWPRSTVEQADPSQPSRTQTVLGHFCVVTHPITWWWSFAITKWSTAWQRKNETKWTAMRWRKNLGGHVKGPALAWYQSGWFFENSRSESGQNRDFWDESRTVPKLGHFTGEKWRGIR